MHVKDIAKVKGGVGCPNYNNRKEGGRIVLGL